MDLFLSLVYNFALAILFVGVIAFFATWALNPTAKPKEIFQHWSNTFNGRG